MQAVYTIHQGKSLWIVNLSDEDTEHIQIVADRPLDVETGDNSMVTYGRLLVVKTLVKKSLKKVRVSDRIALFGRNALEAGRDKHVTCTLPFGKLQVNLSGNEWPVAEGGTIPPESFRVTTRESGTGIPLLSVLSDSEERGLIMDQSGKSYSGEIVGFRGSTMLSMTADQPQGIRFGDQLFTWGALPSIRVVPKMLGRVIDTAGNPLDGKGDYRAIHSVIF